MNNQFVDRTFTLCAAGADYEIQTLISNATALQIIERLKQYAKSYTINSDAMAAASVWMQTSQEGQCQRFQNGRFMVFCQSFRNIHLNCNINIRLTKEETQSIIKAGFEKGITANCKTEAEAIQKFAKHKIAQQLEAAPPAEKISDKLSTITDTPTTPE